MRRLHEGSDANGVTVARPKWTEFSPLEDMLVGKYDAPNREAAPNGVAVAKAFAQEPSSTLAGSRSRTRASLHRHRRCPGAPRKPLKRGIDALAARSSRTAASAATPSDRATQSWT